MPETVIKLTTTDMTSSWDGSRWEVGVPRTASGTGPLCSRGWLHCYRDPLIAEIMRHAHRYDSDHIAWEAEADVGLSDGLKCGASMIVLRRRVALPVVTTETRVVFAILCVRAAGPQPEAWETWARRWMTGEDRSLEAARAVSAASGTVSAAARAAAWAAAWAARGDAGGGARAAAWATSSCPGVEAASLAREAERIAARMEPSHDR